MNLSQAFGPNTRTAFFCQSTYTRVVGTIIVGMFGSLLLLLCVGCVASSSQAKRTVSGPGPADENAPTEFTATDSGLKYRVLRQSDGKNPTAADTVTVNYRGWLDNGKEFDSSYSSSPATFPLSGVVPGWTEGLQLVGEGGMIELEIPSELGYGQRGSPGAIPPNATLHFIVELIKVSR